MRIIDDKPSPKVVKTIVCLNCGKRIEYVPNDVNLLWSGRDIGGGPDGAEGFNCPGCGKQIITHRW
jgi:DNA-directed RNA polymerase subunit RPC12/RpoP